VTLHVHGLGGQGDAVARLVDGEIVLLAGGVPGDVVRARLLGKSRGVLRADLVQVLTPSPDRGVAPCPVADRCGGCDWQHVGLDLQRREKTALAQRALGRGAPVVHLDDRVQGYGQRRRVRLHLREVGGVLRAGMMARGSDRLVPTDVCPILEPALETLVALLPRALTPWLSQGEVYATQGREGAIVTVHGRPREYDRVAPVAELMETLGLVGLSLHLGAHVGHAGLREVTLPETEGPLPITVDAAGFAQATTLGNTAIREAVLASLDAIGPMERCDEFYAGSGNLSALLVGRVRRLRTIESDDPATVRARKTLAAAALLGTQATVLCGDAAELAEAGADLWLLDPGRPGARDLLEQAGDLGPRHVVYVSCALDTLGRDLKILAQAGYVQRSATLVDTFPHTPHAEMIVRLEREG
jgi:23S rRNA (uracil1939-C5)-methyltransferase